MAGTLKRLLPCPIEGDRKQSIFWRVKGKNRARRKEKDKKENRKEKKRKLRKTRIGSIGHAPIDRFLSLPLQILPSSKTQTRIFSFGQQPFRADSLKAFNLHGRILFLGRLFALRRGILSSLALPQQTKPKT